MPPSSLIISPPLVPMSGDFAGNHKAPSDVQAAFESHLQALRDDFIAALAVRRTTADTVQEEVYAEAEPQVHFTKLVLGESCGADIAEEELYPGVEHAGSKRSSYPGVEHARSSGSSEPLASRSLASILMEDSKCRTASLNSDNDDGFASDTGVDFELMASLHASMKEREHKSSKFDIVVGLCPALMILLNLLMIGVGLDIYPESLVWDVLETCFVVYYCGEIAAQIVVGGFLSFFKRMWNWFDVFCAIMGLVDCSISWYVRGRSDPAVVNFNSFMFIKLLRLSRLVRLIRLARHQMFHELRLILQGLISGARVLFWALVLLFGLIYVLGVVSTQLLGEDPEFATVDASMMTVFRCFTDGCGHKAEELRLQLRQNTGLFQGWLLIYFFCMVLVTIGVFNLITAIFIDNVNSSHVVRRQRALTQGRLQFEYVLKELLCKMTGCMNLEHELFTRLSMESKVVVLDDVVKKVDRPITRRRFIKWLENEDFSSLLLDSDIEVDLADGLFDALDADRSGHLTLYEIVEGLMKLRGPVAKTDIVEIIRKIDHLAHGLDDMKKILRLR
eukprot:TRINITY_DN16225_c0_g1_i1.p1 TRINITY_DN16225_c0_g1~~TRINITY_DN16225_c0_g1_i1.p1  ORF type:complete len:561 (+),score=72.55 TRINITY_DN16225_c0_g1_i1:42-1724(+)